MAGTHGADVRTSRLNLPASSWDGIWDVVGRVLVINLGFACLTAPVLLGLLAEPRPWRYPLFFAVLALPIGPAVAASIAFLDRGEDATSVRDWFVALAHTWRRALSLWAVAVAALLVVAADIAFLHGSRAAALVTPMLVVAAFAVVAASFPGGAIAATQPDLGWSRTVVVTLVTAVRHPWLTALNLAVAVVLLAAFAQAPLTALAALPGCAAVVWWRNGVHASAELTDAPVTA